jgi:hypothetical protein
MLIQILMENFSKERAYFNQIKPIYIKDDEEEEIYDSNKDFM